MSFILEMITTLPFIVTVGVHCGDGDPSPYPLTLLPSSPTDILATAAESLHSCVPQLLAGQACPGEHDCEEGCRGTGEGYIPGCLRARGIGATLYQGTDDTQGTQPHFSWWTFSGGHQNYARLWDPGPPGPSLETTRARTKCSGVRAVHRVLPPERRGW